jgi:CheY-like chemotaxis protein
MPRRLLLRVEIPRSVGRLVTYTVEVGPTSAFLRLDDLPARGEVLPLRLSFPGLFRELRLEGRVLSHHTPADPAAPTGVLVEFLFPDRDARMRLHGLLEPAASRDPAIGSAPSVPYRVLLVEDNDAFRGLFARGAKRFLRAPEDRLAVDFASDATRALAALDERPYDLVVVDYYLPGMLGSELIRHLRADPRSTGMALVAMSVGGASAREPSLEAGADLFLDKPLVLRDLFSTLDCLATKGARP